MPDARKPFRREGEAQRREDLIAAALDCVAEKGLAGATVREIALRAGVTPGLIRHYFDGRDQLIEVAYRTLMRQMTAAAADSVVGREGDPAARLAAFVQGCLRPPVADGRMLSLWAGFISLVNVDARMAAVHREEYLGFRDRLEPLIRDALAAAGHTPGDAGLRRLAIAVNAVLDGLWLEASLAPDVFGPGELAETGLQAVGAILSLDLSSSTSSSTAAQGC